MAELSRPKPVADTSHEPAAGDPLTATAATCTLEPRLQNRNALIFAGQIALIYLAAPALYVGFLQAGLCKRLNTSDTMANLPSTVFLAMAWGPVAVAWLFPQARLLKKVMGWGYAVTAAIGLGVAAVLLAPSSPALIIGALVVHAAVLGITNGVVNALGWEALNRGVDARLRGRALGLAYGWGPGCAVVSSLGAQLILDGKLLGWTPPAWLAIGYPYNYALLYAGSAGCMALAAYLASLYRIPVPHLDVERETFQTAVVGGFQAVIRNRILLIACVAYLLMYCGNMVQNNMSIFTREAVGRSPEDLAGYQLTLRFSFKMLCGFMLGWLLARTNPKVPLLVTAGLQIAGVLWVLLVPGYWFLLAFGINGAGELFGVYYMNYPAQCSPRSQVRRNIAMLALISTLVGLSPVLYGWISDTWSLRASFCAALVLLLFTTALVIVALPKNPRPRPEDMRESDLAPQTPA